MDVNESEKIIATCRDTMLTALEKVGGQSLISALGHGTMALPSS